MAGLFPEDEFLVGFIHKNQNYQITMNLGEWLAALTSFMNQSKSKKYHLVNELLTISGDRFNASKNIDLYKLEFFDSGGMEQKKIELTYDELLLLHFRLKEAFIYYVNKAAVAPVQIIDVFRILLAR